MTPKGGGSNASQSSPVGMKETTGVSPHTNSADRPLKTRRKFEAVMTIYLIAHMIMQNYNVYKQNLYTDNLDLMLLSSIVLSRRLIQSVLGGSVLFVSPCADAAVAGGGGLSLGNGTIGGMRRYWMMFLGVAVTLLISAFLLYLLAKIAIKQPLKNLALVMLPPIFQLILLGWAVRPSKKRTELVSSVVSTTNGSGVSVKSATPLSSDLAIDDTITPSIWDKCFVRNLTHLVITVGEGTYYSAFIPIKVLQNQHIYYDIKDCILLLVYVFINCSILLCCYLCAVSFYEMYIYARNLGSWSVVQQDKNILSSAQQWKPHRNYTIGTVVSHCGKFFTARDDPMNTSEPGNILHIIIHNIFAFPERTHSFLIVMQIAVVLSLLILVSQAREWPVYGVMLLFGYWILWLCISTRRENLTEIMNRTHLVRKIKPE